MKLLFLNNTIISRQEIINNISTKNTSYNFLITSYRKCSKPMVFNGKKTCSSCSGR
jgi:hypothetical protein